MFFEPPKSGMMYVHANIIKHRQVDANNMYIAAFPLLCRSFFFQLTRDLQVK